MSPLSTFGPTRAPLDYIRVATLGSLAPEMKVRGGTGKYLLKKAVSGLLPAELHVTVAADHE